MVRNRAKRAREDVRQDAEESGQFGRTQQSGADHRKIVSCRDGPGRSVAAHFPSAPDQPRFHRRSSAHRKQQCHPGDRSAGRLMVCGLRIDRRRRDNLTLDARANFRPIRRRAGQRDACDGSAEVCTA